MSDMSKDMSSAISISNEEIDKIIGNDNEEVQTAEELKKTIAKMNEDREKKIKSAKEQLVADIRVASEQMLTARGVAHVMDIYRSYFPGSDMGALYSDSGVIASKISKELNELSDRIEQDKYDILDYGTICDNLYKHDAANDMLVWSSFIKDLVMLDFCSRFGHAGQDILDFYVYSSKEIKETEDKLDELESK